MENNNQNATKKQKNDIGLKKTFSIPPKFKLKKKKKKPKFKLKLKIKKKFLK